MRVYAGPLFEALNVGFKDGPISDLLQAPTLPVIAIHPRPTAPSNYSRSPKVGNPIAAILKSNAKGIPALWP